MTGATSKSYSHRNFSLHSHQKFRSESGNNPLSDPNPSTSGQSKPSKTSSMPYSISPSNPGTFSFPVAGVPSSDVAPPRSPDYGFHMLERRTIAMADGKIRFYFALPPDYQGVPVKRFLPPGTEGHGIELGNPDLGSGKSFQSGGLLISEGLGRDGNEMYGCGGQIDHCNSLKRKYGDEYERDWRDGGDEFARRRQQLLQFGSPSSKPNGVPSDSELDLDNGDEDIDGASTSVSQDSQESGREIDDLRSSKDMGFEGNYEDLSSLGFKHPDMNQEAFMKAFLRYSKLVNEDASQRKNYLEDGKHGPLYCLACGRTSKDFPDMHGLIMHAYNSQNANLRVDHLGLHKALCVLMGWNYAKPPDNSKAYQSLSSDVAMANKDDLIMWPPLVIIRNTNTRRRIDGIMKGMKNKEVNLKIRDLGFDGSRSKSLYGKDGHLGITLVRFTGDDPSGLNTAIRLAEYFKKDKHGRREWSHAQISQLDKDDDSNPLFFKVDKKGKKEKILYGYLGTASDLDQVNLYTRETAVIISRREKLLLN